MTFEEFKSQFTSFDSAPFARGGQKEVYGATHPVFGPVVVKVLLKIDARTQREIGLIRTHDFPNVPRIFSVDSFDNGAVACQAIIEERVNGTVLRDVIRSGKRYDLYEAANFVEQMLTIIDRVWEYHIVHRDIKPENIVKRADGEISLLDFGIARIIGEDSITETGQIGPFTPGYAAPEVFTIGKSAIDTRADIFSIGVVAYELITGTNPFTTNASSLMQVLYNTTTITPLHHTLEGDTQSQFMGLVSSMMSRDRFARPRDAAEALRWLSAARATFS